MLNLKYGFKLQLYLSKLNKRVEIGKKRAIYRVLGLIRTTAKRSMRLKAGPSRAPAPPHAHTRAGLRVIAFVVDPSGDAGMVGPLKFSSSSMFDRPVPNIHEFGGLVLSRRNQYAYPERPYMSKTLNKLHAKGKIPRQFAASLGEVL